MINPVFIGSECDNKSAAARKQRDYGTLVKHKSKTEFLFPSFFGIRAVVPLREDFRLFLLQCVIRGHSRS